MKFYDKRFALLVDALARADRQRSRLFESSRKYPDICAAGTGGRQHAKLSDGSGPGSFDLLPFNDVPRLSDFLPADECPFLVELE